MQEFGFQIMALGVLALFYGAYLAKMASQARRGIKTRQIGGTRDKTSKVEIAMAAAVGAAVAADLLSIAMDCSWLPAPFRILGFVVGLAGCLLFILATMGLKDSWRAGIPKNDDTEFVNDGIYGWSRNPAFLGFDLMYIGLCLMFCNPLTIVCSLIAAVMLHVQIRQEEGYLTQKFGETYLDYQKHVMRYFGRR